MKETISTERIEELLILVRKWENELRRLSAVDSVHYESTHKDFEKLRAQVQQLEYNATNLLSDFRL